MCGSAGAPARVQGRKKTSGARAARAPGRTGRRRRQTSARRAAAASRRSTSGMCRGPARPPARAAARGTPVRGCQPCPTLNLSRSWQHRPRCCSALQAGPQAAAAVLVLGAPRRRARCRSLAGAVHSLAGACAQLTERLCALPRLTWHSMATGKPSSACRQPAPAARAQPGLRGEPDLSPHPVHGLLLIVARAPPPAMRRRGVAGDAVQHAAGRRRHAVLVPQLAPRGDQAHVPRRRPGLGRADLPRLWAQPWGTRRRRCAARLARRRPHAVSTPLAIPSQHW